MVTLWHGTIWWDGNEPSYSINTLVHGEWEFLALPLQETSRTYSTNS